MLSQNVCDPNVTIFKTERNYSLLVNRKFQQQNSLMKLESNKIFQIMEPQLPETLTRDLFITGIAYKEARCLIYQQDSDQLTIDQCVHLVSSFESVCSPLSSSKSTELSADMLVISIRTMSRTRPSWNYYGCGSTTPHPRHQCPTFKLTCHHCNKVGQRFVDNHVIQFNQLIWKLTQRTILYL